jgi:ribosomal protein S18 acetylase RimI-like enzyme
MEIRYEYGNDLDVDATIELLRDSTLGERRPVDDRQIIAEMLEHGNLTVTAWDGDLMVGFARTLTDFSYTGYMSDLAVRASYQHRGIGTMLVQKTRERMGPRSMLVLLAAPKAVGYYPKVGFRHHESAWLLRASDPFPS